MMDVSKMSMSEKLSTILAWGFWFFMNPEAFAPHLNAPLFAYWEVFCVCHGAQWLLSFVFRSRK